MSDDAPADDGHPVDLHEPSDLSDIGDREGLSDDKVWFRLYERAADEGVIVDECCEALREQWKASCLDPDTWWDLVFKKIGIDQVLEEAAGPAT